MVNNSQIYTIYKNSKGKSKQLNPYFNCIRTFKNDIDLAVINFAHRECYRHLEREKIPQKIWIRYSLIPTWRRQLNSILQKPSHHDDLYLTIHWKICPHTSQYHGDITVNFRMTSLVFLFTDLNDSVYLLCHQGSVYLRSLYCLVACIFPSKNWILCWIKSCYTNQQTFYNMSRQGSRVNSPSRNPMVSYEPYVPYINSPSPYMNNQTQNYSSYSLPNKHFYTGTNVNKYNQSRFTTDEVSKLTGSNVNQGTVVKGKSRIEYVPYQKKVIDYETRTYTQMVPKTRKVVDYEQRKVIQTVPREVVKQDYYAVQKITQYYKEFIPEKKVQMVPVQKKVKRIQYIPVEKQIVHYPQNEDWRNVQGRSRVALESQGVMVKPDAEYRPIQSDLLYKYVSSEANSQNIPVGYVDMGSRRYLSTAPTMVNQNLAYSNVQYVSSQNPSLAGSGLREPLNFHQSQAYLNYPNQQPTLINRMDEGNFNNVLAGTKYQYRYRNVQDYPQNYNS